VDVYKNEADVHTIEPTHIENSEKQTDADHQPDQA
jgi:hypothetical protein